MTFTEIYTAAADQFGDTSAAMIVRIKRYINWSQQDVCARLDTGDFLYKASTIATVAATKLYSLASDAEKVMDITISGAKWLLDHVTREDLDNLDPARTATGTPYYWTEAGRDASGYLQIELYPVPDAIVTLGYNYRKASTDLSNDSDKSIIPAKYHKVLYLGALAQCYDYDQDPSSITYWTQYDNMVETMRQDLMSGSEDNKTAFQPYGFRNTNPQARLNPSHFRN